MRSSIECFACGKSDLSRDEVGINKKLLNSSSKQFYCLDCFAEYLGVTKEELLAKIEEFKEQGCTLF